MKKKTIIAIVGPSGSGKTTLSLFLYGRYGIPYVCSYTTRPMRDGEMNGVEHIFATENDVPDRSEMIAYTVFGGYQYWATKSQVKDVTSYVIDEKGLVYLMEKFGDEFNIFSVYVTRENNDTDQERMDRDNDRILFDESEYDLILHNNFPTKSEMCITDGELIVNALKDKGIEINYQ
jgi:guanylate kinase